MYRFRLNFPNRVLEIVRWTQSLHRLRLVATQKIIIIIIPIEYANGKTYIYGSIVLILQPYIIVESTGND